MNLNILTRGRVDRQITYDNLPQKWKDQTTFVVQQGEEALHKYMYPERNLLVLPKVISNLHQTRQYLLDNVHRGKVVEMDDDIVFSARRTDDPTKFRKMLPVDFDEMFFKLENTGLGEYCMSGIVAREGANRRVEDWLVTTRQMRLHAFNADILKGLGVRWDLLRSPGPEDFCMLLQLFTKGQSNIVLNEYCQNQGGSNTSGGVSIYRTLDVHADACEHLAELFPDFVKVVEKTTKGAWGGATRKDVVVQWKRALKAGGGHVPT